MTNIRQSILEKRNSMNPENAKLASREICNTIYKKLETDWKAVDTFLCYYPLGNEVDITPIYQSLLSSKNMPIKKLYFPITHGDTMDFYRVSSLEELKEGRFHIMEPDLNNLDIITDNIEYNLSTADVSATWLCFTPGVVFDQNNNRMGFGRGFYDRYFTRMSELCQPIIKVGLAYDFQIVDQIPVNPWDVPMDLTLTVPVISSVF